MYWYSGEACDDDRIRCIITTLMRTDSTKWCSDTDKTHDKARINTQINLDIVIILPTATPRLLLSKPFSIPLFRRL